MPPGTGNYGEPAYVAWKDMPYADRVAKAKELLAAAGFGPDNPLKLTLSYNTSENHKKVAIAVAAMWKQLGVETELLNSEVKVHYDDVQEGNFEVARAGLDRRLLRPPELPLSAGHRDRRPELLRATQPRVRPADGRGPKTADLKERAKLLHQAEALAMADMPNIPIYYYVSKDLVAKWSRAGSTTPRTSTAPASSA